MAQFSSKISPFPNHAEKAAPPIPPYGEPPEGRDPTRELRSYIEGLQEEARVARQRQERLEEDRDRLSEELRRLQRDLSAAELARTETRDLLAERDNLLAEQEKRQTLLDKLSRKAELLEHQRSQVEQQRNESMRLYKEVRREVEQHTTARDEAVRQRDAAFRQRDFAGRERAEAAAKCADLQLRMLELEKTALKKNDAEYQRQLTSIRQARDSAWAQVGDLKIRVAELEDAQAALGYEREGAENCAKAALTELEAMRANTENDAEKAAQWESLNRELAELSQEHEALRKDYAAHAQAREQLSGELRALREAHQALQSSFAAQIDTITLERDAARARVQERDHELEELRTELATAWSGAAKAEAEEQRASNADSAKRGDSLSDDERLQFAQLSRQREDMRLQVIELSAQLENAQYQIKQLGAAVAAGRLQAKGPRPIIGSGTAAQPLVGAKINDARDASRSLLADLRTGFDNCLAAPDDFSNRRYLQRSLHLFAEQTLLTDQWMVHTFGASLSRLLEASNDPEGPLTPLPTMTGHALELIGRLLQSDSPEKAASITGRRVLIVDDDPVVCETVVEILKDATFVAESVQNSSGAIAQLACQTWDLIVLDVHMPEIDGFELCSIIRGMAQHAGTPVIFLTGSPDEVPSAAGGLEVLGKPCLPEDLTLRAMTLIVRAQLDAAKK